MSWLHRFPRVRGLLTALVLGWCLGGSASYGQSEVHFYGGAGLNVSYAPLDSLNWILDQYNQGNRSFEKELGSIQLPLGPQIQVGALVGNFMLDLSYNGRFAGTRSKENEQADGSFFVRQVRYRANTFNIGLGGRFLKRENSLWTLGGSLDFGTVRMFTRFSNNSQVGTIPLNAPIVDELNLGTTVFLQGFFNIGLNNPLYLTVRPYFQWAWNKIDFQPLNRVINNANNPSDPLFILESPFNVGLVVGVVLYSE